ncbi:hypothetical protein INR49_009287 [Caranx melampygus]|nr:hypothetical protein INR49_009287 [Caranx melampygus]
MSLAQELGEEGTASLALAKRDTEYHLAHNVLTFDSWPTDAVRVREVQRVSVSSSCDSQVCSSTFYSLSYGDAKTGLIPVSASAQVMEAALNHLWSIRPDKVQVTKQDDAQGSHYTVTFNSDRGKRRHLSVIGVIIGVIGVIIGVIGTEPQGMNMSATLTFFTMRFTVPTPTSLLWRSPRGGNMETFTLVWGGIPTKPIAYNATEAEVQSALEDMMTAECPAEIQTSEGTAVKYFQDFEGDDSEFDGGEVGTAVKHFGFCGLWSLKNPQVLFKDSFKSESGEVYGAVSLDQHSMGMLKNEVGMKFKYRDVDGKTKTETAKISTVFTQSSRSVETSCLVRRCNIWDTSSHLSLSVHSWSYKCLDLQSLLQTDYIGSGYELLELYLYRDASGDDFYVDAVHIGKRATTSDERAVPLRRRPPPFEHSRRSFESLSVSRNASAAAQIRYQIRATPMDCAFDFPLLRVAFLQMSISSEDATEFTAGATNVTVTRPTEPRPL